MKKIKAIGLDMDYTLVRYHTENFEEMTYYEIISKLIKIKNYPSALRELSFDFKRVIQGLVIDKKRGNILKLSRFGKVKSSYHGTQKIAFCDQQKTYSSMEISLEDDDYKSLDTSFSLSQGIVYAQLVDLKDKGEDLPNYEAISNDVLEMLDLAHRDGVLKKKVKDNIASYIVQDPELPRLLETYKGHGKKLMIITNSDYQYTKMLMDFAFTPFLKKHKCWSELFDLVITLASKPHFFTGKSLFLKINPSNGSMSNVEANETVATGVFQGGNASQLERDLQLDPGEILYLGDHIYGDVVSLKKSFAWRTALVFSPIYQEIRSIKAALHIQKEIDRGMVAKVELERKLNRIRKEKEQFKSREDVKEGINDICSKIETLNSSISTNLEKYQGFFNPYWGQLMRSGYEESLIAGQIEKYACIYMGQVSDLFCHSPKTYFRPFQRVLPHEH